MLDLDIAQAHITTTLTDAMLEDAITREEAWLARRIGPLDGERVETFITDDGDEVLQLQRPASTTGMVVEDAGGAVTDYELRGWSDLVRTSGSWSGAVTVTYTPDDSDEVVRALITLLRLSVHESAYQSQAAGGYSSTISLQDQRQMRYSAWRSLLRPVQATTTRLKSAIPAGGESIGSVVREAAAS